MIADIPARTAKVLFISGKKCGNGGIAVTDSQLILSFESLQSLHVEMPRIPKTILVSYFSSRETHGQLEGLSVEQKRLSLERMPVHKA